MNIKPSYEELEKRLDALEKKVAAHGQIEETFNHTNEEWESTFNAVPDLIAILDNKHRIVRVNKAMADKLGIRPDEAVGRICYEHVHGTEEPPLFCPHVKLLSDGQEHITEVHEERLGGDFLVSVTPLHDVNGRLMGCVHVARDITERKRAEEALRESEEKYSSLFHRSTDAIFIHDLDGNIVDANQKVLELFGYTKSEILSIKLPMLHPAEALERSKWAFKTIIREGFVSLEIEFNKKNGKVFSAEVSSSLFEIGGKEVIQGIVRDITERKQAEEALKESEEKYRTVLETSLDPIVVYDIEGKVTYFNPAFTRIFGWTLGERLGKKMDLFVPGDAWPETQKMIEKVLAGENFSGFETRRYTKKGDIIHTNMSAAIYKDKAGNPIGSVINLRDFTEQKKLETQLQQAQKMESVGTLAGGIAHDFNNILGIILGNTELAMDDVPERNPAKSNLEEIKTASLRAKDVIRQLLSFARKTKLEKKPINIIPIIIESLKLLRSSLPTSIEIRQNILENVDTILADPTQINQVLINLCTNADHAMPDGGTLEVSLENVELSEDTTAQHPNLNPGRYVNLAVRDTGHGMSPKKIDRIFDPYFTTKEVGRGSGLGLSVVHGIVKSHKGVISVESEPGKGTIFNIFFPVVEDEPVLEIEIDEELPTGNERILYVDDEESMVHVGRHRLERLGYKVATQTSPVKALEIFRGKPNQFDLVITDMTMPQMTGDHLVEEMLKLRPDLPIIICTGFSEKIDKEKANEIGIRQYIEKPFSRSDLAKLVRKVLDEK